MKLQIYDTRYAERFSNVKFFEISRFIESSNITSVIFIQDARDIINIKICP